MALLPSAAPPPFELHEKIGHGSYGIVYRATPTSTFSNGGSSRQEAAVKVIELESIGDEIDEVQGEIAVLSNANCPQLISYIGSYVVGTQLWIAMEYLSGGSLGQLLEESEESGEAPGLGEPTIRLVLRELLLALRYLHAERKIHRDIKVGDIHQWQCLLLPKYLNWLAQLSCVRLSPPPPLPNSLCSRRRMCWWTRPTGR